MTFLRFNRTPLRVIGVADPLFDLERARRADGGPDSLSLDEPLREARARRDIELPSLFPAEGADFAATALLAVDAEDPFLLRESGFAFLADQAVGRSTAFPSAGTRLNSSR